MKRFLIAMLLAGAMWGGRHSSTGGTPIPAAASGVSYTTHTFSTASFTTSNVDSTKTFASGFSWYLFNFYSTVTPTSAITINANGTLTTANTVTTLASAAKVAGMPAYVGTLFGCGGYFVAELSFSPQVSGSGFPAWWALAGEQMVGAGLSDQWSGQAVGYEHFEEVDTLEFDRDQKTYPDSYGATLHDSYGIYNVTCPGGYCHQSSTSTVSLARAPLGTDWTLFHRVAFLWVPATVSTDGYIKFYFDDILMTQTSWTQFTTQSPPPTALTTWTHGVLDQQHLILILGSGAQWPLTIRSVDVWQGAGACNLTN